MGDAAGSNQIVLSLDVGGKPVIESFTIEAISPASYASVGSIAFAPADAHTDIGRGAFDADQAASVLSRTGPARSRPQTR